MGNWVNATVRKALVAQDNSALRHGTKTRARKTSVGLRQQRQVGAVIQQYLSAMPKTRGKLTLLSLVDQASGHARNCPVS